MPWNTLRKPWGRTPPTNCDPDGVQLQPTLLHNDNYHCDTPTVTVADTVPKQYLAV
jgi:hypothetical protein